MAVLGLAVCSEPNTKAPHIKPIMVSTPQTYKVLRGGRVLLDCNIKRLGQFVVLWRKGDRILAAGNHLVRKDGKVSVTKGHDLELDNVTEEDGGWYMCEVDIGLGGETRAVRHKVVVLTPPLITTWHRQREVNAGQDLNISCEATGNPAPQISWRKYETGQKLLPDVSGQQLVLQNIRPKDAGMYICKAVNSVSSGVEKVTRVTVNYAPEVRLEQVWIPKTETFELLLVCHIDSHPEAKVVWFNTDNIRLSTTDEIYIEENKDGKSVLKIETMSEIHLGSYKCRATNQFGQGFAVLEVTGKPRPPRFRKEQQEIVDTGKAVSLHWSTDSISPVTQYRIYYRRTQTSSIARNFSEPAVSSRWLETVIPVPSNHKLLLSSNPPAHQLTSSGSHTLRNLEKESVYDVRVRAMNKFGMSNYSKVFNLYVKTAPAAPDFASPRFLQTDTKEGTVSASQRVAGELWVLGVLIVGLIVGQ